MRPLSSSPDAAAVATLGANCMGRCSATLYYQTNLGLPNDKLYQWLARAFLPSAQFETHWCLQTCALPTALDPDYIWYELPQNC